MRYGVAPLRRGKRDDCLVYKHNDDDDDMAAKIATTSRIDFAILIIV
jgi:hypothetical protein